MAAEKYNFIAPAAFKERGGKHNFIMPPHPNNGAAGKHDFMRRNLKLW